MYHRHLIHKKNSSVILLQYHVLLFSLNLKNLRKSRNIKPYLSSVQFFMNLCIYCSKLDYDFASSAFSEKTRIFQRQCQCLKSVLVLEIQRVYMCKSLLLNQFQANVLYFCTPSKSQKTGVFLKFRFLTAKTGQSVRFVQS